ncbi:MAG: response regulator transcription factor [Eubacterium sp.]
MIRVLIAEDDPAMRKILKLYFEKEGYETDVAEDGIRAIEQLEQTTYDLAVLDWMMPGADGIAVLKAIKSLGLPVKTILLTVKGQIADEIEGFESGADDYVRKPFEPQVLLLRVRKLLNTDAVLAWGDLRLEEQHQRVLKGNTLLMLHKREYDLLAFLMRNPGRIISREMLLDRVWGMDYEGDDRTVDTHIKRLRAKIGKDTIKTYRGLGYALERCDE